MYLSVKLLANMCKAVGSILCVEKKQKGNKKEFPIERTFLWITHWAISF